MFETRYKPKWNPGKARRGDEEEPWTSIEESGFDMRPGASNIPSQIEPNPGYVVEFCVMECVGWDQGLLMGWGRLRG